MDELSVIFSEDEIERRLEELDGARFQKLCEDYCQLKFPHPWLLHLDPRGRRTDGTTVAGSPDFFGRSRDDLLVIGEASKQDDWFRWLSKDITEWEKRGFRNRIGAFYAFSWHAFTPDRGTDEQKREKVRALAGERLGLPADSLVLLFRRELVRDLAQPACAQLVRKHLGIPWSIYPWLPIDAVPPPAPRSDLTPSADEFVSESVQVDAHLLAAIDTALSRNRELLISGPSACGKTTLALAYAFHHEARDRPAFYLDCKSFAGSLPFDDLLKIVEIWRSPHLLLVVDNIHLALNEIDDLGKHLQALQFVHGVAPGPDAFSIVYVSRTQKQQFPSASYLAERLRAAEAVVEVVADESAFRAVHDRMARRHGISPAQRPTDAWARMAHDFGQNLLFFGVACNACGRQLANPFASVEPRMARSAIQEYYLYPLGNDRDAYHNLLTLCVLAELELSAPHSALRVPTPFAAAFGSLVADGLVHERSLPDGRRLYDLEHPSLGTLVLEAQPGRADRQDLIKHACLAAPSLVIQILNRAWLERGLESEPVARVSLEGLVREPRFLDECLSQFGAQEWRLLFLLLHRRNPELLDALQAELSLDARRVRLVECLAAAPLDKIAVFLRDTERNAPRLWSLAKAALARDHLPSLLRKVVATPPHFLKAFLQYSEKSLPKVFEAFIVHIGSPEGARFLGPHAARASLGNLRPLLEYLHKARPSAMDSLIRELGVPQNRMCILETALQTRLDGLADFLRFCDRYSPSISAALRADLASERAVLALADRAVHASPLSNLRPFLQYASRTMPAVARSLAVALQQPRYRPRWLALVLESPAYYLEGFLRYADRELPEVSKHLKEDLQTPTASMTLVAAAAKLPLHLLASFLRFADAALPKIAEALRQELGREEGLDRCLRMAKDSPLGDLTSFLGQAKLSQPTVYAHLRSTFFCDETVGLITARAVDTPLEQLRSFLEYCDREHQEWSRRLGYQLQGEHEMRQIAQRAADTPLEHLARFLRYAEQAMPSVAVAIWHRLARPEEEERLALRAVDTPVEHLTSFLRYAQEKAPQLWTRLRENLARDDLARRLLLRLREADAGKRSSLQGYLQREMPDVFAALPRTTS